MRIPSTPLTPALTAWLASRNDPGTPALAVRQDGAAIEVTRADGTALSAHEEAHVRGVMAANAVGPLAMPGSRKKN
jgi:hypothetical protein